MDLAEAAIAAGDSERLAELVGAWSPSVQDLGHLCNRTLRADCVGCAELLVTVGEKGCGDVTELAERAIRAGAEAITEAMVVLGADLEELVDIILKEGRRDLAHRLLETRRLAETPSRGTASLDLDARDEDGETALTRTLRTPGPGVFQQLLLQLVAGADPDLPDAAGHHPLTIAARRGRLDLVWALRAHGAVDPPSAPSSVDLLWDAYRFEPRTVLDASRKPRRVEVVAPQDLRFAKRTLTDPASLELRGRCCFGSIVDITLDQDPNPVVGWVRSWLARVPPKLEREPQHVRPFHTWEGLSSAHRGPMPSPILKLQGFRGCHRVSLEIQSYAALAAESEELARRIYATIQPSPCMPWSVRWLGVPALLAAVAGLLGRKRILHSLRNARS